jgi:hypothetical protein
MDADAESLLTKQLIHRSGIGYLIGHGLSGLAIHTVEPCSVFEHGMAILFALPGLLLGVGCLLLVQNFYSWKWCRRILKIPLLGTTFQVWVISIPLSFFVAIVIPGEEGYWPLLSVVGVGCGLMLAQSYLINR